MQQLQESVKYNVIGRLLNHAFVFANNVLIVRLLGGELSGFFFNEWYVLGLFAFVFSFGFDYTLVYLLARHTINISNLINKILLLTLGVIIVFCVFYFTNIFPFRQPFIAVLLFTTGNFILIAFQAILTAYKKFSIQNLVLVVTNFILLVYLISMYYSFLPIQRDRNRVGDMVALAVSITFIVQGCILFLCMKYEKIKSGNEIIGWKQLLTAGLRMMLSSIIFFIYLRIDNFFVEKYCTATVLSNYVQCGKIGQYFMYLPTIVSATLLPHYVKIGDELSYRQWKKVIKPYVYILLLICIVLITAGKFILPQIFGPDFEMMYSILMIFLPGFFGLGMLTLLNTVFYSKGNIIPIIWADLMGLILLIILDVVLVPFYGVYAAAGVSCFCYLATLTFLTIKVKKQFSVN